MNHDENTDAAAIPIRQTGVSQPNMGSRRLASTVDKPWRLQKLAHRQSRASLKSSVSSSTSDPRFIPESVVTDVTVHPYDLTDMPNRQVGTSALPVSGLSPLAKFPASPSSTRRPVSKKTIGSSRLMAARKTSAVYFTDSDSADSARQDGRPASPTQNLKRVADSISSGRQSSRGTPPKKSIITWPSSATHKPKIPSDKSHPQFQNAGQNPTSGLWNIPAQPQPSYLSSLVADDQLRETERDDERVLPLPNPSTSSVSGQHHHNSRMSDIIKQSASAATPTRAVTDPDPAAAASTAMWGVYTPRKSLEFNSQPLSRMSAVSLSTPKFSAAEPLDSAIYNSASPDIMQNIAQADIERQSGQQMDTDMDVLMTETHVQKSRRLPFLLRNVRRGFALVCHELGLPTKRLPGESSSKLHIIMRSMSSGSISEEEGSANCIIQRYSLPFLQCPLCHLHKKFVNSIMLRRHIDWDHPDIETAWSETTAGGAFKLRITINATFPEGLPVPLQISPRNTLLGAEDGGLELAPDLHSAQSPWEDVPLVTSMSQIKLTNEISASTANDAFHPRSSRASSHEFSPSPSRSSSSGSLYHQRVSRGPSADAIARRRQFARPVLSEHQKRKARSARMKNQRRPPPPNKKGHRQHSNHHSQQWLSISDEDEDDRAILDMLDDAAEAAAIAANDSPRSLPHAAIQSEHPPRTPELAHHGSPNFINRAVLSSVLALDAGSTPRVLQLQNPPRTLERSHSGSPDPLNQDLRLPTLTMTARSTPRLSQPSAAGTIPHEPIEGQHSVPEPTQSTPAERLGDSGTHAYTAPTDDGNPLVARRPGGPRIYDAVNATPLTQFGMLSWFILEREEEMFELHDICDEDKVLQALWGRWALLNRLTFGDDYYAGTLLFIEDNWMTIHQAADWVTLRAFLLTFVINRFLTGQEVAKLLKHYNSLVEADYG